MNESEYVKGLCSILGIEPTDDLKKVKHAYAAMIKNYHPEENPEGWEKVHNAYVRLTAYLKNNVIEAEPEVPATAVFEEPEVPATEEEQFEGIDDIYKIVEEAENKYQSDKEKARLEYLTVSKDIEQYLELSQFARKVLTSSGLAIGGRRLITKEEYEHVRSYDGYMMALRNQTFVELIYNIVSDTVIEKGAATLLKQDINYAKKNCDSLLIIYDKILRYLKNENNLYSKNSVGTYNRGKTSNNLGRFAFSFVVILLVATINVSLNSYYNNGNRTNTRENQQQEATDYTQKQYQNARRINYNIEQYREKYSEMELEDFKKYLEDEGYSTSDINTIVLRLDIDEKIRLLESDKETNENDNLTKQEE